MKPVRLVILLASCGLSASALAHDPVFGLGPHVLFKEGVEIAPEARTGKAGDNRESEFGLELTYGLTGDWAAGISLPYERNSTGAGSQSGQGDAIIFTKYRFWREDSPGAQQSMSLALKLKTNTGDNATSTGTTDYITGLAYGYESRSWYRWAALRYRINGTDDAGLKRGDRMLFDLVGGYRPKLTGYREPDTVWLLELNGEFSQRAELGNITVANSGGSQWFVSPGIFWTLRNFAIKAGIQIPVASDLNGNQSEADYRARLILEWHL